MNKAQFFRNFFIMIFSVLCLFLFNIGCGLDEYIIIPAPQYGYGPTISSNFDEKSFGFNTTENNDWIKGTDVYYKIYDNNNKAQSDRVYLENIATDDEQKYSSYTKMSDRGYQRLICEGHESDSFLINAYGKTQKVEIRLTDYRNNPDYKASIIVDDNASKGRPVRYQDNLTFNFGNSGSKDAVPKSSDKDASVSSGNDGKWYVNMFAVSVGLDVTLAPLYSNIVYLGTVCIEENSDLN